MNTNQTDTNQMQEQEIDLIERRHATHFKDVLKLLGNTRLCL